MGQAVFRRDYLNHEAIVGLEPLRATVSSMHEDVDMDIEKAMKNPGKVFGSPDALLASTELTLDEKRAILKQWKDQLQQLQAADDENMPGPGASSDANADTLRRVSETLTKLETQPGSRIR